MKVIRSHGNNFNLKPHVSASYPHLPSLSLSTYPYIGAVFWEHHLTPFPIYPALLPTLLIEYPAT
jgi:hypothetical protein